MKNLAVGVFHDDQLSRELGKKGTESDILMCNKKTDDSIYTFLSPVDDKLTPKSQIMSGIDAAVLSVPLLTPEVGETILMLDAFRISRGIIVIPPYTDRAPIQSLIKGTTLTSFQILERDTNLILNTLQTMTPRRDQSSPPMVVIDHSFSVKGVGEVILGFVKKGVVRKHDTLQLLPANKEIVVRSIQMQDADVDEAEAGSRVGLAIKGAIAEEMKRGCLLCPSGSATVGSTIPLSFTKNRYYPEDIREGLFHAAIGMQTVPVTITKINNGTLTIDSEKPVTYTSDTRILLMNLNAKKLHVMGYGTPITQP
jgi:selenocysteine-specific translation elongation factor